jgi:CHAD domain-containing protein
MPFRFKKKESVARAVRRLCCERLDDALETLEKTARFEAVHNVRKEIKKLRSILRLTRGEIGEKTYRKHTKALREAANLLTAFRDAQVKLSAFDDLSKHFKDKLPLRPKIKNALRDRCRAEERKLSTAVAPLKAILCESKEELDNLKLKAKGWQAIGPGLKKVYGRGLAAFETISAEPSEENFHEWRKRVKDLWHQLNLLYPARPGKLRARTEKLEKLGNLLGDDHDLFMLREFVTKKFPRTHDLNAFELMIFARQRELRTAAVKLGRRFYREKPNRFCRRIGDYWRNWRRKG